MNKFIEDLLRELQYSEGNLREMFEVITECTIRKSWLSSSTSSEESLEYFVILNKRFSNLL